MKVINSVLLVLFTCITAQAQITYQPKTIKVSGSSEMQIEPNEIHLVVQIIDLSGKKYNLPIKDSRNEFLAICKSVGISDKDIDMSYIRSQLIAQKISFWRKKSTALQQREIYDIKFTDMGMMLNFIEKVDKPYVQSISFGKQTHTEMTEFRKQVKEDATKAAILKAKYLATAAEQEIGNVVFIEEVSNNYHSATNRYSNTISYRKQSLGGSPKVNFGFQPIALRYEVLVICELK